MHFLLVFFCFENLYLLCLHMTLFLSLCIYHYHHKQSSLSSSIFIKMLTFLHIFSILFNNVLSLDLKDNVLLLSNCLTYPIIYGSFKHKGLMTSSSLYPRKYLNELFFIKRFFFGNLYLINIKAIYIKQFFVFVKVNLIDLFIIKNYFLFIHSYT